MWKDFKDTLKDDLNVFNDLKKIRFKIKHQIEEIWACVITKKTFHCPKCGTQAFQPYGGWWCLRHGDQRHVRRYLCKACGYYLDEDGEQKAVVYMQNKVWTLECDVPPDYKGQVFTPKQYWDMMNKVPDPADPMFG